MGLAPPETIERWRGQIERGERARAVREFLHQVGGYSHREIQAMETLPVWGARLAVAHTIPRELEAEHSYRLDPERLRRLAVPTLMLVGSESPGWAIRSTEAYAAALPHVAVRTLDGHGHGGTVSGPELVAAEVRRFLAEIGEIRRD